MEWKKQLINYGENVGWCVKIHTEGRKKKPSMIKLKNE